MPVRQRIQEKELIQLLQQREERGFRLLYEQYGPNLLGITLRIVRSSALAEDVLQEAFLKIWHRIDSYNPAKGSLFTWLLTIVRNTALDQLRALSAKEQTTSKADTPDWAVAYTPIDHIGLDQLLVGLSKEHQSLIDYLYFKGYTQAEAAQALGLPLGTVKTKLRAAMLQLRQTVKPLRASLQKE